MRFSLTLFFAAIASFALAQPPAAPTVPDLKELVAKPQSEMADVVRRYEADRGSLQRTHTMAMSPTRIARMRHFHTGWQAALDKLASRKFSDEGKSDFVKLKETVARDLKNLDDQAARNAELAQLLPFAPIIIDLEETRRRRETINSPKSADKLIALKTKILDTRKNLQAPVAVASIFSLPFTKSQVASAVEAGNSLRNTLKSWHAFYDAYDPVFTWWMAEPFKAVDAALQDYMLYLKEKVAPRAPDRITPAVAKKPAAPVAAPAKKWPNDVPDLNELISTPMSEMRAVIQRYTTDRGGVGGRMQGLPVRPRGPRPPEAASRSQKFQADWLAALKKIDFEKLSQDGKVDYILLRNSIERDLRRSEMQAQLRAKYALLPDYAFNALQRVRVRDESGIEGRPIGRDALIADLQGEMIPYSPEDLIAIAEKEYAWCEAEMKKASRDMGFGDDWKKAVEKVKTLHVQPGKQPDLIRALSDEAVEYLRKHDLVTVVPLCDETWRIEMMTPQRQLISPFFTGGEVISVAFPTNTMSHEAKLQSLRGNNIHFARATVHHELIPGHHLQGFMTSRYKTYRGPFNTSFWTEGGALYWEFVLYQMGFPRTPEDRVGFLTWRMHRCARIVFSLGFHLGKMKPQECIDYLVKKVGFERDNAAAEVRRSFGGGYGPLYQLSYMMGGLQIWSLRRELVDSGKMSERAFHDAMLKESRIPIAMIRASLTKQKLTRDYAGDWKFYGPEPAKQNLRSEAP